MAAALLAHPAFAAKSLLKGEGFETGEQEWKIFLPLEHNGSAGAVKFEIVKDAKEAHDGKAFAELTSTEPIRWGINPGMKDVKEGKRYRISAWVKFSKDARMTKPGAASVFIRATLHNAAGQDLVEDSIVHFHIGLNGKVTGVKNTSQLAVPQLPTRWEQIEAVVEIPQGAAKVNLVLFINGIIGTVYWDDVVFEEVPNSTPVTRILD